MNVNPPILFSVIIATRNREKNLRQTLRCLDRQRFPRPRYEILVIDNGSEDRTCAAVAELRATIANLHYFFLGQANVSASRNLGAKMARGRWLAFTDDDCLPPQNWLSQGEKILQSTRGIKVFGGPIFDVMPRGVSPPAGFKLVGWKESYGREARFLSPNEFFIECNLFMEKRQFIAGGGFKVLLGPGNRRFGFHEGTELQARIAARHPAKTVRYYDPSIQMRHLVRVARSSTGGRFWRAILSGFDYTRAFPKAGRRRGPFLLGQAMGMSSLLPFAALAHRLLPQLSTRPFERFFFRCGEVWGEILGNHPLFQNHTYSPTGHRSLWQKLGDRLFPHAKRLAFRFGQTNVSKSITVSGWRRGHSRNGITLLERKNTSASQYRTWCRELGPAHPLLAYVPAYSSPPWIRGFIRSGRVYGATPAVLDAGDRLVEELSRDWGKEGIQLGIMRWLSLPPVEELSGRTFLAAQLGGETYFHWMVDVLPLLLEEQRRMGGLKAFRHILTHHPLKFFHRQTFERLGVPPEKILGLKKRTGYRCQELVFHTAHHQTGRAPAENLLSVARLFLGPTKDKPSTPRRLALLRGPESSRVLLHRREIADLLVSRGFVDYEPSGDTIEEQARKFAGAELIVGVHGAALTNLIFCRPGTRVLELFSARYVNPCYVHISQQLGLLHTSLLDNSLNGKVNYNLADPRAAIETTAAQIKTALRFAEA